LFGFTITLGSLCFEFTAPLISIFSGLFGLVTSNAAARDQSSSNYSACKALADGKECEYCDVCDDGQGGVGVIFSCGELKTTTCTTISTGSLPTSTRDASGVEKIVPSLVIDGTA
jgi:hypothetical protein